MKVELISYTPNPVEHCAIMAGITTDKKDKKITKEEYDDFVRKRIKQGHLGVIEHASFSFKVEGISRVCSHQWVRHRIGSFLQRSQRRVDESKASYILPNLDYLIGTIPMQETNVMATKIMKEGIEEGFRAYKRLRALGVRPEDARFVLPNATETKIGWTINGRALRHFFKLRLHKSTQWEIREMAKRMFELLAYYCPIHKVHLVVGDNEPPFYEKPPYYCSKCERNIHPIALPFFEDLTSLYLTAEGEGGLE